MGQDWIFLEQEYEWDLLQPDPVQVRGRYFVGGGFEVEISLNAGAQLVRYSVTSTDGRYPLTASARRSVDGTIRALTADLRSRYVEGLRRWGMQQFTEEDRALAQSAGEVDSGLRRMRGQAEAVLVHLDRPAGVEVYRARVGRPRKGNELTREHFEQVARLYDQALTEPGYEHRPNVYIAEEMGYAPSTVAKWVARCRDDDMLLLPKADVRGRVKGNQDV